MLQPTDNISQGIKRNWLKHRIMWPVFACLLLVVAVSLFLFINLILSYVENENAYDSTGMGARWQMDMFHHQHKLGTIGSGLSQHPQIRAALKLGDRGKLLEVGMPIYTSAKKDFHVEFIGIIDAERRVLVRYHALEAYGDQIDYSTVIKAEATQKVAYGLDFGYGGRLVQRSITPVFEQGRLLGYIGVGELIDDLLQHIDDTFNVQHVALIEKDFLKKHSVGPVFGTRLSPVDIDRFSSLVIMGSTIDVIPQVVQDRIADNSLSQLQSGDIVEGNNQFYNVMTLPVVSGGEDRIGTIIIFRDITDQYNALKYSIMLVSVVIILVLAILYFVLFQITQRTETRFTEAYNDLKQTRAQLDTGQQYWDDAFNAIDDPVFIHDALFRVIRANSAYADRAGMAMEDIIGQPYYHCFPKSEQPMSECVEALHSNVYSENEHTIELADGTIFLSRRFVTQDNHGAYLHSVHILQDVTKERQTEHALKENKDRIESIMSAVPTGVGVVSNRIFQFVNDKTCEITGYTQEELIGKSSRILYPDDEEYERVGRVKYADIRSAGSGTVECRMQRKDGRIIDVLLSSSAINQNDLVKGVTFTLMDISERKLQERKLTEQLDELQRFLKVSLSREDRIKELRDENNKLKASILNLKAQNK